MDSSKLGPGELSTGWLIDVLTSNGIGVWTWDLDSGEINWTLPRSGGVSEMELRLSSPAELVDLARIEDRSSLAEALRLVDKGGENLATTFRLRGIDERVIRIQAQRFQSAPSQVVGIAFDETSQVKAAAKLASLFDERDRVARALETALLPPTLPSVPGLSVDAAYTSSEGAATGDFYDLFPIQRGYWALSIGDVGGHGTAAAAITTSVRYSMRAAGIVRRDPTRVLLAANSSQLDAARDERFTTCHFLRMRRKPDGLSLRVATAGHPDMLIKRATGGIERFSGTGPMLGLVRRPEFVDARETMDVGDVLVAYTDGVTETRRGNEFFGEDGLVGMLQDWSGPIQGFAEALHDEAQAFNDGDARDDMATVAIRVEELEAVDA